MKTGILGNGISYAVKRGGKSVAWCALSVKCGTRDEGSFKSGTAHFAEHCVFKGTKRRTSSYINSYLDRLGGELNAFTTKEETVFHATVLREDLFKAMRLLFELVFEPVFPERAVSLEKNVIIEEIKSYKDSPADDIYDKFEEILLSGHELSRPILGKVSTVAKIESAELLAFTNSRYLPENICLTVVADENEEVLSEKIQKAMSSFPCPGKSANAVGKIWKRSSKPLTFNHFHKEINKRSHSANLVLGGLAPGLFGGTERYAAILLGNVLAGPTSNSILNLALREKRGLVYDVETNYTQYGETGVMSVSLGCDKSNMEKCLQILDEELGKLMDNKLSDNKLRVAKRQLEGQLAISGENGETQVLSMGKSLMSFGDILPSAEVKSRIEALSAEDLREAARKIFRTENRNILIYN